MADPKRTRQDVDTKPMPKDVNDNDDVAETIDDGMDDVMGREWDSEHLDANVDPHDLAPGHRPDPELRDETEDRE